MMIRSGFFSTDGLKRQIRERHEEIVKRRNEAAAEAFLQLVRL